MTMGGRLNPEVAALMCSAAVLTDDAIALLEDVDVGQYHDYK